MGVILAVAGSAVGLGNFLRFPGQVAEYGGGAFMAAYFISFLLIGLPICWAEWTMGRYGGQLGFHSSPGIFNAIWRSPAAKYVGIIGVIIPVVIYMYYVYIEAWCLGYAVNFLVGNLNFESVADSGDWWGNFIGIGKDGAAFGQFGVDKVGWYLLVAFALNFVLVFRGLRGGIEIFCRFAVPTLVLLAVVVLIRVLTLAPPDPNQPAENVNNGLGFLWNPNKVFFVYADPANGSLSNEIEIVDRRYREDIPRSIQAGSLTPVIQEKPVMAHILKNSRTGKWSTTGTIVPVEEVAGLKAEIEEGEKSGRVVSAPAVFIQPIPMDGASPITTAIVDPELLRKLRAQLRADSLVPVIKKVSLFQQLTNPQLWLAAAGQIFFSLSVGFGVIITYSSYLRKDDDVVLSGLSATSANEFCEVALGGLITVPAAVAFIGVAGLAGMLSSTFTIGFVVMPQVFAEMPGGNLFGFLWFFLLFLAAVTSSISMLQPGIAFIEETMRTDRARSCAILGLITAIGCGMVVIFSKDVKALDTLDFWVGTFLIFVLSTIQIILFGWVFGVDRGLQQAHEGAAIHLPQFFAPIMKYVAPVYLLVIFVMWIAVKVFGVRFSGAPSSISYYVTDLFGQTPSIAAWLSVGFVIVLFIFFAVLVSSVQRYRDFHTNWKEEA